MKRDGHLQSLWQSNIDNYSPKTTASQDTVDVVIIGGGITGVSTALQLQKAGKKCVILEAQNLGFGTTSGTTAHLNTTLDTPYYQIKKDFGEKAAHMILNAVNNAIDLIKRNIAEYNIECTYLEVPTYLYAEKEEQVEELEQIADSAREVGVETEYVNEIPVPIPFVKAAKFGKQGQFDPIKYLHGIAEAFEKAGGTIITNARVTDITSDGEIAEVIFSGGKIKTHNAIYATHIPPGVNILHFRAAPYRSYAMGIKLKDDNYPDSPAYDMDDPYRYYRTQEKDGQKYLIAGGEDHKTGHEEHTLHCFDKLEAYIRKHFNIESIDFKWSSQYFEPADGLPYIGHLPGNPKNIYVATGFGGNGMIYGSFSALVLTDLIAHGDSEYKALLSPDRVKPVAGFQNFMKEAADVAGVFIGGLFSPEKIKEFADIAKGEAKVVIVDKHTVALYKDDNGKLHAVNPSCPHIKCTVGWNDAEKSWDCPCHGSRFSYDGELLTAPARKNLEQIDLKDLSK